MDKTLQDALDVARHIGLTDRDIALAVTTATEARRAEADGPEMVTMDHPNVPDRPIRVLPDAVEHHQRSGWQVRAEEPPPDDEAADDAAPDKPAKATKAAAKKETS